MAFRGVLAGILIMALVAWLVYLALAAAEWLIAW